jgi:hypothetical protein
MKKFILFIAVLSSLLACDDKNGKVLLPTSIGRYNELMVVINQADWDGKIGLALKKVIASNVLGLPQPETQFAITHIPHQGFDGFLKHNRNILSIEQGKESELIIEFDVYSKPQVYMHLKGPDKEAIAKLIKENKDLIIKAFKESDIKQIQKDLRKKVHKTELVKTFKEQGYSLKIPMDYTQVDDTGNFIWYRKEIQVYNAKINGSMNIISYTLPLEIPFEQLKDSVASIRDMIGKKHIPGAIEGSYLITEAAYAPHIFEDKLDGKEAYKVKGKWEVYKDFMAGPFVSYIVNDTKNKRIVVVEGFTYAPVVKKRDLMFELEAIIRTLHIE